MGSTISASRDSQQIHRVDLAPKEINLLLTCNVQALSKASLWGAVIILNKISKTARIYLRAINRF